MHIMSIDCEFAQPSGKTIQIGAAVFQTHDGKLIDSFDIFVNPYEFLTPFITELTGITDVDVQGGVDIKEAFKRLKEFHEKHRCFMNPIVWGSGVRNDSLALWEEANPCDDQGNRVPNFMGFRVIDAKTIYQTLRIAQGKSIKGGLFTACGNMGITFEGRAHNAYWDAFNTFKVWHKLANLLNKPLLK